MSNPAHSCDSTAAPRPCLHVMGGGHEPYVLPLRAGLSIGRDPLNSLVIDHPDAYPIHATIDWLDDALRLECAAGAVVILADGTETPRLNLLEGTRCRIGDTVLTCFDSRFIDVDEHQSQCARCGHGLDNLPVTRQFCPRCGLNLSTPPSTVTVVHQEPIPVLPVVEPREPVHSLMIAGYATAMNKLGVRYEVGQGVARNEDEAIRCYGKAARLGNDDARTRLERWQAPHDTDSIE